MKKEMTNSIKQCGARYKETLYFFCEQQEGHGGYHSCELIWKDKNQ